ncbi:MAG: hypothetical protein LBQ86_05480 [Holophagales bacterium]|nr:hypothetical protein [Holophagales bacterium]
MRKTTLLVLLVSSASWAQEVNVYTATFAQYYKQDIPGLERTYAPLTQFLGIDATKLGTENFSLHLFGWGNFDLADQTRLNGKTTGSLTYGYARYRFDRANGELQAGRFAINHGLGYEQIDGVSGRVDLKGGFNFSAFGGRPVYYDVQNHDQQRDYRWQRDIIFGARLGYRIAKMGEIGVSFLQDGTATSRYDKYDNPIPTDNPVPLPQPRNDGDFFYSNVHDYRRKLIGGDIIFVPISRLMFTGRTVFDIADRTFGPTDLDDASKIAENDYSLSYKFNNYFSAKANYVERNFQAYFAGSNMPSLFSTFEKDKHRSYGASVTYLDSDDQDGPIEITADYKNIHRETFGDSTRFGFDMRMSHSPKKFASGLSYHRIKTSDVVFVDPLKPSYSLSHHESRAWLMYSSDKYTASLDCIEYDFDNSEYSKEHLNGQSKLYEFIASVGIKPAENLRISADLAFGSTSVAKNEARGLLRVEYKFGFAPKGGK